MRLFWIVFFIGGMISYFVVHAADVDYFNWETAINNFYHFFAGFILVVLMINLKRFKYKFRLILLLIVLILILGEGIDYLRSVTDFSFINMLYNLYFVLWGTASGYGLSKTFKRE